MHVCVLPSLPSYERRARKYGTRGVPRSRPSLPLVVRLMAHVARKWAQGIFPKERESVWTRLSPPMSGCAATGGWDGTVVMSVMPVSSGNCNGVRQEKVIASHRQRQRQREAKLGRRQSRFRKRPSLEKRIQKLCLHKGSIEKKRNCWINK